jgi:methylthioribose-1-phosphate isomerase
MRTVVWDSDQVAVQMIDQRLLPEELKMIFLKDHKQVAEAIQNMVVRGAPAIGASAAFGLALTAQKSDAKDVAALRTELRQAAEVLQEARPTAVNLSWALNRVLEAVSEVEGNVADVRQVVLNEAQKIADEDVEINKRIAEYGATLIDKGDTVIHHCNTGALATVDWGTALGVIRLAHEQGKQIHVLVDETRPRLQGARLTAWELDQYSIPYDIISDNAAGYFLSTGQVNKVLFGADRVAANGDVANKIGTYMLTLAAYDNNVPAYSVVPTSTIDLSLAHGGLIPIEERASSEVLNIRSQNRQVAPDGATARNPAFDITPHRLISGIVTEKGLVQPPFKLNLVKAVRGG